MDLYQNDDMKKQLNTALYIRLSREDGDKEESNSISHQRSILEEYVKNHEDLQIYDEYVDDGYSGTNFQRPGFERLLSDIKLGKVNCILVKDLSRFARDYVMAGLYIERYFPEWNIRFISIGESYDSQTAANEVSDILLPIQNLFNEFHARDTSRKVQRVMHSMQKEGKCVSAFVPYGYQKSAQNKHQLVKDEYAGTIVQRIFSMYLNGYGMMTIAKTLNSEEILCPSAYKKANGLGYVNCNRLQATSYWTESTIRTLLQNEVYTGTLVQGKTIRGINKKPKRVPPENWIRVKHAHEAIVSEEVFEKAQSLMKRNARSMKLDEKWSLFAGLLKCGDCGRSLCKTEWNGQITYKCGTYKRIGRSYCSPHAIKESLLKELLLEDLNIILGQVENLSQIIKEQEKSKDKTFKQKEKLRQQLKGNLEKSARRKMESYDDYKEGLLSKEEYLTYAEKCDSQCKQMKNQLELLEEEKQKSETVMQNPWIQKLLNRKCIEEIDREMVLDMVREIQIFENNTIKIVYNFSDELDYLLSKK